MIRYHVITSIAVDEDGSLQITYHNLNQDVKARGLAQLHTLIVPRASGYDDETNDVLVAVNQLITTVTDAWSELAPGY